MFPQVSLTTDVSRDDVGRIRDWLRDPEVSSLWYGTDDSDGHALHIGYAPERIQDSGDDEWQADIQPGRTAHLLDLLDG